MSHPSAQPVLFLIEAFRRSQAMFTAVELRIFDSLALEPLGVLQLAALTRGNVDALERLLNTLVALNLLDLQDDCYSNTEAAQVYLVRSSPQSLIGYIEYSQRALWQLWAKLPDAVREGTHRWEQVFGGQGELFAHYYRTEEEKRQFSMGMHGFGMLSSPRVVRAFDLAPYRHFVDLGGGTGHLAIAACAVYPQLRATVFDLPKVLPLTQEIVEESGLADRFSTIGGDFFSDDLPAADLYAVGRILHDWTEEKILFLLRKIQAALPPGGALLVAETLLDESGTKPLWTLLQSLNMLVATEGKERTFSEYRSLLEEAGFSEVRAAVLPDSPLDAILARKL